jgi:hypothetical protein
VRTVVTLAVIGITLASCSSPTPDSQTKDAGGTRTSKIEHVAAISTTELRSTPSSISFPTFDDGFISESNYLAHTVDAARSWSEIKPGLGAVEQVQFLSPTKGFVLSHEGLFSSSNAGLTWKRSGSTSPALTWISFSTVKDGWGVADDSLWKTANAGASWKRFATPIQPTVACFVSAGTGWISGTSISKRSPLISKTVDGGRTWSQSGLTESLLRESGQPPYKVLALSCAAPTTIWALVVPTGAGYAGGEMYGVYGSSNGGKSWRLAGVNPAKPKFPAAPSAQPEGLQVAKNSKTVLVVASCGGCDNLGTTTVGVTSEGHANWHSALLKGVGFSSVDLIAFPTDSKAWAITARKTEGGYRLRIFDTKNFGTSWTSRPIFEIR